MDYEKTKKKIRLFKLLEKIKKRDLFRELYNLNLILQIQFVEDERFQAGLKTNHKVAYDLQILTYILNE